MRKLLNVFLFLLLISFCVNVKALDTEFIYTDWFDYYPDDVEEVRIESEDRYRWYKIDEDGNRHETKDYFAEYEGYQIIEGTKKTFYRVINNAEVLRLKSGQLTLDRERCQKTFCMLITLKPYVIKPPEEPPATEEITNPETLDNINTYVYLFVISISTLIFIVYKRKNNNLVFNTK